MATVLADSAVAQIAAPRDEIIADDIGKFPDRPLVHARYDYPAGWVPFEGQRAQGYPRAAVADFDGDGVTDVAGPLINQAKGLYAVVVWSGAKMDQTYTYRNPTFLFQRPLTPKIDVELVQQGPDIRMRVSEDDAVEVFRWNRARFVALGPAKSAQKYDSAGFPDMTLDAGYAYPLGWAPYPDGPDRAVYLPLDKDSAWDRAEVVINASWKRYGVMVWLSEGRLNRALDRPFLLFDAPLKPETDIRLVKVVNRRAFAVMAKGSSPEQFTWNGQTVVAVRK